jgi:WD40 repeat protein
MSLSLTREQKNKLLYIGFNQDYSCFAVGTDDGFEIWNVDPFKLRFKREFDGGLGIVEMLFRSNLLALVGGGKNPKYPPNKVMIWDDYQNKCLAELEFRSDVKGVKLRRDKIVVALENKVYVYNFADLQLVHQIETTANPKGLIALCPDSNNTVLACPGLKPGYVHLRLNDINKSTPIKAHDNPLSCLALNLDGTRLATASEQGTVIRIWDTSTGEQVGKLRRGKDKAEVNCISFSSDSEWLCVSSDRGTVHIFNLANNGGTDSAKAQKSRLSFMGGLGLLPSSLDDYVGSDFSFAQLHLTVPRSICSFGQANNLIIVIGQDGTFYRYAYDSEQGGEGKREDHILFLKDKEED